MTKWPVQYKHETHNTKRRNRHLEGTDCYCFVFHMCDPNISATLAV